MPLGSFLRTLLSALFALAILFIAAVEFSVVRTPENQPNYQTYEHAANEHFHSAQAFVVSVVKWFGHLDAEEWIALGTGVLAVATILLWLATQRILRDASKTSRKELRAYVHLSAVYLVRRSDDAFQVIAKVKNFGKTPARNVVLHVEPINFVDMADRTFDFSPSNLGISKFDDIAPGQIRRITLAERRFNQHVRTEVTARRGAIYFWGVIKYDDVFDDPQTLEFRRFVEEFPLEITPAGGSLGQFKIPKFGAIHMRVCDEGNKST